MRTSSFFIAAALVAAAATAACDGDSPADEPATFEDVVAQVLTPKCTFAQCHSATTAAASLDLTPERACEALVNQPACLFPERMRVVPGSPDDSFFFHKLTGQGLDEVPTANCGNDSTTTTRTNLLMPYGASELSSRDLRIVHDWIAAGAACTPGGPGPKPGAPTIASISASKTAPVAGETITITVTLDKAARDGGQVIALETNSSALSAPVQMIVPTSETAVRFEVYAMRPTSRFTMRARTGTSSKEIVLRVGGLDIAEVLADPAGDDDQLQWIKLHNRSTLPIDLSSYRLQAGQGNYDLVSVALTGSIPAGGCAVIGGPIQTGANSEPVFSQAIDFSPNLPYGGTQAAGFAVFDASAAPVGGVMTPVDTMLVGVANNSQLLGPDGEVASPFCGTPTPGLSVMRTGPGSCIQSEMQPHTCP
jgi:hypothetical protein